ncbi:MAG: UDP-N-acetylmuramoyl-L-alanine--D-glutamate ligase [Anaerolineales bacterium]|nr:UDP-N-acetylmuramoyl-L-alanine--D-glutamate ligase [Anaerolineales bacterium]MCB8967935.1 UDP-N-acetylmuramoyl-L-alanine--D-glutamate ligase [Ardenticatenaceae bacterium]
MDTLTGKTLLILGLARQGMALARYAAEVGANVVVSDMRTPQQLESSMRQLADLEIEYVLGEHPMSLLEKVDVVAISGGVPADAPLVRAAQARQIPVTNDSQEFLRRVPTDVIGITGSAGKTTTTALTGVMGQVAGRRTWVGGNIGRPLIADLHKMQPDDMVVQELSSFQLEIWQQSPHVAAVLNITPNHLDRHKTMAAYADAKANILRYQTAEDVAVLCADDAGALALSALAPGRLRLFSLRDEVADGAFVRDGQVWVRNGHETAVLPIHDIPLRGPHNILNVLAAVTLADTVGIPVDAMRKAILTFTGVEHRLEEVAVVNGVKYINDSIATAPERVLAALTSFREPLVLLAGGKDKDMVWDEWTRQVTERVRHVVLFGELAQMLQERLLAAGYQRITRVETLAEAVKAAWETAVVGDVVLLSPGGTSFDAFVDFAARGEAFRQLVKAL